MLIQFSTVRLSSGQESGLEDILTHGSGPDGHPEHVGYLYHPPNPGYQPDQLVVVRSDQQDGSGRESGSETGQSFWSCAEEASEAAESGSSTINL